MDDYIDRGKIRDEACHGCTHRTGKEGCGWPEPCNRLLLEGAEFQGLLRKAGVEQNCRKGKKGHRGYHKGSKTLRSLLEHRMQKCRNTGRSRVQTSVEVKGGYLMPFDFDYFIERNHDVALLIYGNLIDDNRCVKGTDIWFDEYWRVHNGK